MTPSQDLQSRMDAILDEMRAMPSLVVAFSGGVDSTLVAALAHRALGARALAVTAVSETLGSAELEEAKQLAAEIGIRHELIEFSELSDEDFRANTSARCFYCQSMRFEQLRAMARAHGCDVVASGSNESDLGDHRPGLKAMEQQQVYQPLLTHHVTKPEVRAMAQALGLSAWNKPAKACLSSRIPYGIEVTAGRLRRVEAAEEVLTELGFVQFRVRDHAGHARVEIDPTEQAAALGASTLRAIAQGVREAGFERVSLDLVGYRSGSLNPVAATAG